MESKKQTYIAALALFVSIVSLAVTIIIAVNEYKENLEIIVEKVNIVNVDLDNKTMNCDFEAIVANTSNSSVSILRFDLLNNYSGLRKSEKIEQVTINPELPVTLISGGAEKILFNCECFLDDEEVLAIGMGEDLLDIIKKRSISVRLYTAKDTYYGYARFNDAQYIRID